MAFAKIGSENFVNTTTDGEQYGSAVTQLTNGDVVVAWTDANTGAVNVFGQILNSDGLTKDGAEFRLNTTLTGDQFDVSITALGNGGFAAAWTDSGGFPVGDELPFDMDGGSSQNHITTQVFDAGGNTDGSAEAHLLESSDYADDLTDVNHTYIRVDEHYQSGAAITASIAPGNGEFELFAIEEIHSTESFFSPLPALFWNYEVGHNNIAHFDTDGADGFLVSPVENATYDSSEYLSLLPADPPAYDDPDDFRNLNAITLSNGTAVAVYDRAASNNSLDGVHIDISTQAATVTAGSTNGNSADVAQLANGNIVVVWTDDVNSSDGNEDIRAQILTASGGKIGGEFAVTNKTGSQWTPAVAGLEDGRFVVVWEDLSGTGGDASGSSIKAQILTSDGVKSGAEFLVNTVVDDSQHSPTVTGLANGNFIVTWTSADGSTDDIKSQVFDPRDFTGDSADDTVYGGDDDDTLDGGEGTDALYGGGGDDLFENVTLDDLSDGDIFDGGDGVDAIDFDDYLLGPAATKFLLGGGGTVTGVEIFNLHDSLNFVEIAIPLANSSSTGNVTLYGGSLQDLIYGDRIGNTDVSLFLNGNGGDDVLKGGAGADTLAGGEGTDGLYGNGGDDTFTGALGDIYDGGAGIDTLNFTTNLVSWGGPPILIGGGGTVESIETINLHGAAGSFNIVTLDGNIADTVSFGAIVPGAPLPSVIVNGSDADDTVDGSAFDGSGAGPIIATLRTPEFVTPVALTFNGGGGADHFIGGAGADTFHGGIGADTMEGGEGDDTYFTDDIGDTMTELAQGGTDLVIATASALLSANVENLILVGLGFVNGIGNGLANVMEGSAGVNTLTGLGGDDKLFGLGNNDLLWGGLGADALDGGSGSDTATYAGSTAGVTIDLAADTASGGAAAGDTLDGIENLIGSSFNDTLTGDAGANGLIGGAGADTMYGGRGDDTYFAENTGDQVLETTSGAAGGLNDQVYSSVNHTLSGNVENLTITAVAGQVNGTGNSSANAIVGGSGNNFIDGKEGNDILTGNGGSNDQFLFTTTLNAATNLDQITDFDVAYDFLRLENTVFAALPVGYLADSSFHIGASAADGLDRIIYDPATGNIYYDPDGVGGTAQTQFATVSAGLALDNGNIYVF
ncbi:MAG: beta strand repeat-containing protein [Aestuariivirga sp.]